MVVVGREKRKISPHRKVSSEREHTSTRVEIEATFLVHGRIEQHPEACVCEADKRTEEVALGCKLFEQF